MREAVKYLPEDAKGALRAPLDGTDVTATTPR